MIGLFLGDPEGIGPEIVVKALSEYNYNENILLFGIEKDIKRAINITDVDIKYSTYKNIENVNFSDNNIAFLRFEKYEENSLSKNKIYNNSSKLVIPILQKILYYADNQYIDGIVYGPLNKKKINSGGFLYRDELELFVDLLSWENIVGEMNYLHGLWTARVSSHVSISEVNNFINFKNINNVIDLAYNTFKKVENKEPKIAVCALNPHRGEDGLFGREEIDIIRPVIENKRQKGLEIFGSFSADTIFIDAFRGKYDIIITMYHDQGQIALKLKGLDKGVTLNAGLPFPILTPAHGTAYNIAGENKADPGAMSEAIKLCCKMIKQENVI
ncbi:4-hydroxythreonine-4-phosphate dehydrogenase PdxA [Halanaerobium sp. MA284_MarDTE_T2]|uniref:4-hydroxythreonine-4-phosphate dehydrogenase PdxA n=1 Tax=Halanaerobium sp. MA284_MarDTE_T2 TaxID=2183913 RepID=UPI000E1ADE79|nr:4-hydroxythreonine-4-phosphate dehydrogenase PdxA [Halanaerobium sp. MA284_MarDTE_T2]RCW48637.1 4-hydroxythreonine-4-phosphate dehydrogenase [Halanaerobium sp. MA284_MarDTE_T2]